MQQWWCSTPGAMWHGINDPSQESYHLSNARIKKVSSSSPLVYVVSNKKREGRDDANNSERLKILPLSKYHQVQETTIRLAMPNTTMERFRRLLEEYQKFERMVPTTKYQDQMLDYKHETIQDHLHILSPNHSQNVSTYTTGNRQPLHKHT